MTNHILKVECNLLHDVHIMCFYFCFKGFEQRRDYLKDNTLLFVMNETPMILNNCSKMIQKNYPLALEPKQLQR